MGVCVCVCVCLTNAFSCSKLESLATVIEGIPENYGTYFHQRNINGVVTMEVMNEQQPVDFMLRIGGRMGDGYIPRQFNRAFWPCIGAWQAWHLFGDDIGRVMVIKDNNLTTIETKVCTYCTFAWKGTRRRRR